MEGKSFFGRTALVVGGSGGIGREVSLRLAKECSRVVVHGGRESGRFRSLLASVGEDADAQGIVEDLSEGLPPDGSPLLSAAAGCDVLCVCFGPFVRKPLHETTAGDWRTVALLDYALPGLLVSLALPRMVRNGFGRILLFGGTGTAHRAEFLTNAAYAGAKSALNVLVESCAAAYAKDGVTCNAVLPGFTLTEYTAPADALLSAKMPLGRQVSAATVADAALFLILRGDVNGALLRVDQGWSPSAR